MAPNTVTNITMPKQSAAARSSSQDGGAGSTVYQLRQYLLLLATLVATVTYAAGLNPPGSDWPEDAAGGREVAGDSILRETSYRRYIVFYYFNAISFAALLLVGLLLLLVHRGLDRGYVLGSLQTTMVVDLLALTGAYAAGSGHDGFTRICGYSLVSVVVAYVAVVFFTYVTYYNGTTPSTTPNEEGWTIRNTELAMLMVVATFAATIAYVAGLNPPGGFWRSSRPGQHVGSGDPVLQVDHPHRYKAFFFFNTTAFVASLLAIMLIVEYNRSRLVSRNVTSYCIYGLIVTAVFGLAGAYAAGSCRDGKHTAYVVALVIPVLLCIFLQQALCSGPSGTHQQKENPSATAARTAAGDPGGSDNAHSSSSTLPAAGAAAGTAAKNLEKTREYIQLLATLAASVAYQAGVDPPGGVWAATRGGHVAGEPILQTTYPGRYSVFFYFNSAAFVASLVIMVMLENESVLRRHHHVLEAAVILDLFGLMGAYAAGSCRDTSTSIYVVAMAGAVLVYVVIHIVFLTLDHSGGGGDDDAVVEKYREVLLLLATLAATITYQAGLTPPGGLWESDDRAGHHRAGFPVLRDKAPRRYQAFFYCNAASFMASVALIVLLMNRNLYRPGIQCRALFVCMVAGMFGLMGAYSAGSSLHLHSSIVVFALVAAVSAAVVSLAIYYHYRGQATPTPPSEEIAEAATPAVDDGGEEKEDDDYMQTYLMLVGILAASVTYVTGLKPPGGLWSDDAGNGHAAGNPVLYDVDRWRYNVFFYCNSTSFMASVTIIALLLRRMLRADHGKANEMPLWPMHTAMLLDVLALLGAYAAGSARDWSTSKDVFLLLIPILVILGFFFYFGKKKSSSST